MAMALLSPSVLTADFLELKEQLKEFEKDGLIVRKEYPQVPPKVEYYMSEMGKGLRPVVRAMYEWIEKYDIK